MAKKKQAVPVARRDEITMGFRPITMPDGLEGSMVLVSFTAKFIQWILATREKVSGLGPGFYRIFFFNIDGEWLSDTGDEEINELISDADDAWVELPESYSADIDGDEDLESTIVRSECWTIGIGENDILVHFHEKHCDQELESPELPLADLRAMLERLQ